MKIPLTCMQCFHEQGKPSEVFYLAELQDNGLYYMKCLMGHESVTCLQQEKFEILFELAANAIVDGYYRDAISSFSSSIERFIEFYLKVICIKKGIINENYLKSWKIVAAQSERQLGAFVFVYLLENIVPPLLLRNKDITFRNDVIHKGMIPSKQQATDYGQKVLNIMVPILSRLKELDDLHVQAAVSQHACKTMEQISGDPHVFYLSIPTTISIARATTEPQPTLGETLTRLEKQRARINYR